MVNDDKSLFVKDEPKTVCDVLKDNLKDLTIFVHAVVTDYKNGAPVQKESIQALPGVAQAIAEIAKLLIEE